MLCLYGSCLPRQAQHTRAWVLTSALLPQVDDLMLGVGVQVHMAAKLVQLLARLCGGVLVEALSRAALHELQASRGGQPKQAATLAPAGVGTRACSRHKPACASGARACAVTHNCMWVYGRTWGPHKCKCPPTCRQVQGRVRGPHTGTRCTWVDECFWEVHTQARAAHAWEIFLEVHTQARAAHAWEIFLEVHTQARAAHTWENDFGRSTHRHALHKRRRMILGGPYTDRCCTCMGE